MGYVDLPSAQAAHHALWFLLGPQPDPAGRMVKLLWFSRARRAGSAEYGGNVPPGKLFSGGRFQRVETVRKFPAPGVTHFSSHAL